jgi:hypothetical protein
MRGDSKAAKRGEEIGWLFAIHVASGQDAPRWRRFCDFGHPDHKAAQGIFVDLDAELGRQAE